MSIRELFPLLRKPSRNRSSRLAVWLLGTLVALPLGTPAFCAEEPKAKDAEEEEIPEPEELELQTDDGVQLAVTYFPSPMKEKEKKKAVAIILLHMHEGSQKNYSHLAASLQEKGHAVLVPDLRGHGESTHQKGRSTPLRAGTMSRNDFVRMVQFDLPAVKRFLVDKNNEGELNIEKLCVVGAGMGASVALGWTAYDWSLRPEGTTKQGQDVKAMVLVSPPWSTPGLSPKVAMTMQPLTIKVYDRQLRNVFKEPDEKNFDRPVALDFRKEVTVWIIVGKAKSKAVRDAKRLYSLLKNHHPEPAEDEDEKRDLFYLPLDTSLQGTKMLDAKELHLQERIALFVDLRLAKRRFVWKERKNPYE